MCGCVIYRALQIISHLVRHKPTNWISDNQHSYNIYIYIYICVCVCVCVCVLARMCVFKQHLAWDNPQGLICHKASTKLLGVVVFFFFYSRFWLAEWKYKDPPTHLLWSNIFNMCSNTKLGKTREYKWVLLSQLFWVSCELNERKNFDEWAIFRIFVKIV